MIKKAKTTAMLKPKKTKAWNAMGTPTRRCRNCGHSSLVHRKGPCTAYTCKRDTRCRKFY